MSGLVHSGLVRTRLAHTGLVHTRLVRTSVHRCAFGLAALAWLIAAPAQAHPCAGVPGPNMQSAPGERFALLAVQCPALAGPLEPHRAAQLGLYDRPAQTIGAIEGAGDGGGESQKPAASGTDSSPRRIGPRSRDAVRVVSLAPAITATAAEFGIDPLLLHAVAHIESRHDAKAVSHAGARGLMQVMPATARRFGVGDPERTLFDAQVNLRASAAYLQQLRQRYGEDLRLILAAYNAGEGAVASYGGVPPYAETQAYVRNVLAVYRRLGNSFAVSRDGQLIERESR